MTYDSVDSTVLVALTTGFGSVLVWSGVLVRSVRAYRARVEHRALWLAMPVSALIVSVGTLSSAIGYAIQRGVIVLDIDPNVLSLVASMGRGALFMAGLIAAAAYAPPKEKR